ncbi:PD40 domain-containing protein [Desulforamulus hydrothermalis]|uniref:WD40 domain protein beta Propeller n=1 Tax=Desulforamulus hydrothermalis Lam5 = DSM 18033 TaxID=1121428 RepID=K8EFI1_9FIRM|nr:PD40 domain-containing protein [Desulforamulus hydrothermalis]CCO07436.1 WD40 domain protein beta Propeller [Desulforamulus hydrothermalis Lam5 = DSM 18033]SHH18501.1 TolB protein [Desulforamulus hydrothermalis Lam5 = DSM 18033]
MSEDKYSNQENKVLPIEAYLKVRETGDDAISQLLSHMRQVREAVPVNRRLQAELRKKLLERQAELQQQKQAGQLNTAGSYQPGSLGRHPWFRPLAAVAAALLVLLACAVFWRFSGGTVYLEAAGTPQELTRFWTEASDLQPAVSPDGSKILVVRGGGLVLLSDTGMQLAYLEPPAGAAFRSPSWSPDGRQVALVLSTDYSEEIKQLSVEEILSYGKTRSLLLHSPGSMDAGRPKVMAAVESGTKEENGSASRQSKTKYYSRLVYGPDGKGLVYVVTSLGKTPEVWYRNANGEEKLITEGDAPTWSPDGKHLVVQRPGRSGSYELWLVNMETGGADLLGQGENPVWSDKGYLVFCTGKEQERILTFLPNGEPQFSVRQQVAEIRVAYLGKDGAPALKKIKEDAGWLAHSHLLVAPESRISSLEINWLRQQELSGLPGPKTLVLNEVQKCEGQVLGPEGKWLLFARRDGDTVALFKLPLKERWEKERE